MIQAASIHQLRQTRKRYLPGLPELVNRYLLNVRIFWR